LTNSTKGRLAAALAVVLPIIAIACLYLTGLTRMGMYSTDEPRYAAVGRAMAQSGDWITPKLWGEPWFEKPALLYWMTAAGFKLGLGPDLAPRLPVALLSVAFLLFFRGRLIRIFGHDSANYATAMLATSAGWLAYSHVAVTDVPLAACFSMAVLWALPANDESTTPHRVTAAIALGFAVLAKSIPPLLLFLPVLAMDRRNWRRWFASWPIVAFLAVALPWHVVAWARNGPHFLYVLFIEQQFGRFFNDSRQHEQQWWFYLPFFLLLLFPWFPLLPAAVRQARQDERTKTLAAVVAFGLVFFSASINKLPGYVLPLVPATCALMGVALAQSSLRERWLIAPIALLGVLPIAASVSPGLLAHSLRAAQIPWGYGAVGLVGGAVVGSIVAWRMRSHAFSLVFALAAAAFFWVETALFPALDEAASPRSLWSASHPECTPVLSRGPRYGLYYYSEKVLPDCAIVDKNANPSGGTGPTH